MNESLKQKLLSIESKLMEFDFPPQLVIENTSACNQQCLHCSHKELTRPKKHMSRELWNKIVEEIGQVAPNTELWPTFYGEALILGDELWDRIDYADKEGCKNIVLNSNATLLHRKNHFDRILKSPLKRFILSLDGFTKETYEKIRVHGKWEQVYPNVEELLNRKAQLGIESPAIICQFSLMEENQDEAEDFRKYWHERGAEVKVRPKLEWTATGTIRSSFIDRETDFRIACPWANNTMAIHQDGTVVTCAVDYDARLKVSNVKNSSVKDAWKMLYELSRKHHMNHDWENIPDICKSCRDWQTAGASYDHSSQGENTRPFWFDESMSSATPEKSVIQFYKNNQIA